MDLGLHGRRAVVIGASQGIGRAIAEGLAAEGCDVVIAARNAERLNEVAGGINGGQGGQAQSITVDLFDMASVTALADKALAGGKVDILVNNCGGPPPSGALGVSAEDWRRYFDMMVVSAMTLTERMVAPMRERKWGRVQFILSSGVIQPIPTLGMSNVLRSSVSAFSKTLSREVAADGVTSNVLLPGRIDTDRVRNLDAKTAEKEGITPAQAKQRGEATIPMKRYAEPREFADVAVFLASERAGYVTGSMQRIDGGLIASM